MIAVFLIVFALIFIIVMRKKIGHYLDLSIEKTKDLNYLDEEIEYQILKYERFDSSELLIVIQKSNLTENELRAIRKILSDRNVIIPTTDNFS